MTVGYVGDEKATAETLDSEGWLKTGDICYFDSQGFLYIVDRLKELIKYKAYQVPPAELEHLLVSHPQIADAAVIPYPDEEAGQIPMAYVVRITGSNITEAQVMDFIAKQVAPYKKIRRVAFINSIPKSPAGKILRKELVNLFVGSSRLSEEGQSSRKNGVLWKKIGGGMAPRDVRTYKEVLIQNIKNPCPTEDTSKLKEINTDRDEVPRVEHVVQAKLEFHDIDTLPRYTTLKKQKIWVSLFGVPLELWNEDFFSAISNKWGVFVRLDNETTSRVRFDVARVLVGVSRLGDIPSSVLVDVRGSRSVVRITTEAFEDDRSWIDADAPDFLHNKDFGNIPIEPHSAINEFKNRDQSVDFGNLDTSHQNVPAADVVAHLENPTEVEGQVALGDGLTAIQQISNIGSGHFLGPTENGPLIEVPITTLPEPSNLSLGQSDSSNNMVLDNSGLVSVKLKYVRLGSGDSIPNFRTNFDCIRQWASFNSSSEKVMVNSQRRYKRVGKRGRFISSPSLGPLRFVAQNSGELDRASEEDENLIAKETLGVCNAAGLIFAASKRDIIERFKLVGDAGEAS
ncbi:hypothetical protein V6N13_123315 [Hibiscus sabdariffa]